MLSYMTYVMRGDICYVRRHLLSEVTCGTPPPVNDAEVTPTCVRRGCVADYRCYVGYEGQTQRSQCSVDGKWTRVSIKCTRMLLETIFYFYEYTFINN